MPVCEWRKEVCQTAKFCIYLGMVKRHIVPVPFSSCYVEDIPESERAMDTLARFEGITVVMNRAAPVVQTVWRNHHHGLRHIRQKPRYSC